MSKVTYHFFMVWFLLLPFTLISTIYIGVIAIDKQVALSLVIFWVALFVIGIYKIDYRKLLIIVLAFCFFFIRNISFISDSDLYSTVIWADAIKLGYFSLPILYVDSLAKTKTACKLISINATVGCVSAFLVSVGLLNLPYERFSHSRIGIEHIQKSIGLFTTYGDMAQYSAYFLLLALFLPSNLALVGKEKYSKLLKISAVMIVIAGLIGCQSRSYLLSLIVALVIAMLFNFRGSKEKNKVFYKMMLISIGMCMIGIVVYLYSDIVSVISGFGGSQAQKTAIVRLHQYQYAFDLIKENPVFGANAANFSKYSENIRGIHNMWLGQTARGGFISFFLLSGLFLSIFLASLKILKYHEKRPYGVVSIGYVFAVFVSTLFYPADSSLFWALLGMNASIVSTLR